MMYPLVRDLAAAGVPVAVTCRVLGFSKQAFYAWYAHPVSDRDYDEAHLLNAAYGIRADDPEFGHRFIAVGFVTDWASERRVWRLCSQQRLFSQTAKRPGRAGRSLARRSVDDRVERDHRGGCQ